MKAKLICLLLVVCTLLVPFAGLGVSAGEAEMSVEANYDDLYVKEGLTIWLDAFDASAANSYLDLAGGKWYSKVGGENVYATIGGGVYSDENIYGWRAGENGGIEWNQIALPDVDETGAAKGMNTMQTQNGLFLDPALIPSENYTVEAVVTTPGIMNADGTRYAPSKDLYKYGIGNGESTAVGSFRDYVYICLGEGNDQLSHRWYYTGLRYTDHYGTYTNRPIKMLVWESGMQEKAPDETYTLTLQMQYLEPTQVQMKVLYNLTPKTTNKYSEADYGTLGRLPYNNDGYTLNGTPSQERQKFQFFVGLPSNVRAIRVYDRALSEEEQIQNRFADIVKFYSLDLTQYLGMNEKMQDFVKASLTDIGFTSDKATAQKIIADAVEAYEEEQRKEAEREQIKQENLEKLKDLPSYDRYYVTDGLYMWLDAFVGYNELNPELDLEEGKWYSKVGNGLYAEIGGKEYWKVSDDGRGIGYFFTKPEFQASLVQGICPVGLHFDASLLTDSFTVDCVANIRGITNSDGTRYVDPSDSSNLYGIYGSKYSTFSFGIFKSMTFLCKSEAKYGTDMGHRWCYTPKEWGDHNGSQPYRDDYSLGRNTDGASPISYTIVKSRRNSELETLQVNINGKSAFEWGTYPLTDPEPEFHVFKGLPSTIYAVRVYDRALSQAERDQNHVADLMQYYMLETDLFDAVLANVTDKASFYALFRDMGFDMTVEEATIAFTNYLGGAWIKAEGISVRLDQNIGIRGEFQVSKDAIHALKQAGYQVEVGALLNIGGAYPTLEDHDSKVVFLKPDGTYQNAFFYENDQAAFAVQFQNPTALMKISSLNFSGYIIMTKDEKTTVLYMENRLQNLEPTVLSAYDYLYNSENYGGNRFAKSVVESCYEKVEILLSEDGNDHSNGVDAPVKTLERAYELLLGILSAETPVDITLRFDSGRYELSEYLMLDKADVSQKYFRLTLEGVSEEEGESIVTGAKRFDGAGFESVEGKPYYKYQFAKDTEGNYPDFYYFYANGVIQEVAHDGYNRTYEAETLGGGIDAMWKVTEIFKGVDKDHKEESNPDYKLYLPAKAVEKITAEDFGDLEFHLAIAWYYRVLHIKAVDFEDTDANGNVAVFFYEEEVKNWSAQHLMKGHYFWFENALSFVDEPGEYYYDRQEGTLYYYPAEDVDMDTATFEIPQTDLLLAFRNLANVTLRNLVFTGTDHNAWIHGAYMGGQAGTVDGPFGAHSAAAVYTENSKHFTVDYCIFRELAGNGFRALGATTDLTVESNRFFHIGASGIKVGDHNGTWNEATNKNENLVITNNYLDDIAFSARGAVAIYVNVVKYLDLSYNTVMNTSYSAVSVGWRWGEANWALGTTWNVYQADICYNYFESFMTDQSDGGAIYTLGGNVENSYHLYFNELHKNLAVFTEKTWDGQGMVMPYYHDGASSNWHTHDNVEILYPGRTVHTPIYLQNINGQLAHNIMVEENEVVGAFKTWPQIDDNYYFTATEVEYKIFGSNTNGNIVTPVNGKWPSRVDANRDLKQQDNMLYDNPYELSDSALSVMDCCGSEFMMADSGELVDRMQTIYDEYYEQLQLDYEHKMEESIK